MWESAITQSLERPQQDGKKIVIRLLVERPVRGGPDVKLAFLVPSAKMLLSREVQLKISALELLKSEFRLRGLTEAAVWSGIAPELADDLPTAVGFWLPAKNDPNNFVQA